MLRYHDGSDWTRHTALLRHSWPICPQCNRPAPELRRVTFRQNIAIIFARFPSRYEGEVCKACVHRTFWQMNTISTLFGWWGYISIFANAGYVLGNLGTYAGSLRMKARGRLARADYLTADEAERLAVA